MADFDITPGTGAKARGVPHGSVTTQIVGLDLNPNGAEALMAGTMPVSGAVTVSGTATVSGSVTAVGAAAIAAAVSGTPILAGVRGSIAAPAETGMVDGDVAVLWTDLRGALHVRTPPATVNAGGTGAMIPSSTEQTIDANTRRTSFKMVNLTSARCTVKYGTSVDVGADLTDVIDPDETWEITDGYKGVLAFIWADDSTTGKAHHTEMQL